MRFNYYLSQAMDNTLNISHLKADLNCSLITQDEYIFLMEVWTIVNN